jgi:2-dehydropantoate 2-reductase
MKIAVFGSGAIGGYFGGRLAQAGHDVTFIARGSHLDAIKADGLQVKSIHGDFVIHPAKATDRPETVGSVDVVLCCVKSWQVSGIAESIRLLCGPHTVVIPLQNGVEAHTVLSRALDSENNIVPGVCRIISLIEAPGRIHHAGADPHLVIGELDGGISERVEEIARTFSDVAGMAVHASRHILPALWKKFMLIAPWSGLGALTRAPIGVIRSMPESRDMLVMSIREVFDVAVANGVGVDEAAVDATMGFIDQLPPGGTASMQRDIMAGRPSELNEQSGAVVRFGETGGVQTPVNRFIYHSLLPLERIARGEIAFSDLMTNQK